MRSTSASILILCKDGQVFGLCRLKSRKNFSGHIFSIEPHIEQISLIYMLNFSTSRTQKSNVKRDVEVFQYSFQHQKFLFHNIYLSLRKMSALK